jgi:hypothetical protein
MNGIPFDSMQAELMSLDDILNLLPRKPKLIVPELESGELGYLPDLWIIGWRSRHNFFTPKIGHFHPFDPRIWLKKQYLRNWIFQMHVNGDMTCFSHRWQQVRQYKPRPYYPCYFILPLGVVSDGEDGTSPGRKELQPKQVQAKKSSKTSGA